MCSRPPPVRACAARWNSSARSPPFQNSSSKRSVSRAARFSWNSLTKICHQDHSERSTSSTITAWTTNDACVISVTKERSACTFKRESPFLRRAGRECGRDASARRRDRPARSRADVRTSAAPEHVLPRNQPRRAAIDRFDRNLERIVQSRGLPVVDLAAMHDEDDAVLALEGCQREAEGCQPLGARAFHELQVVGIVNDSGGVGILVVNANGEPEGLRAGHSPGKSVPTPPAAGGVRPKWR